MQPTLQILNHNKLQRRSFHCRNNILMTVPIAGILVRVPFFLLNLSSLKGALINNDCWGSKLVILNTAKLSRISSELISFIHLFYKDSKPYSTVVISFLNELCQHSTLYSTQKITRTGFPQ